MAPHSQFRAALLSILCLLPIACSGGGGGRRAAAAGLSTISFASRHDIKIGQGATAVAAADIDGDGHLDLIVTRYSESKVTFVRGLGNDNYASGVDLPIGPFFPIAVAIADLDDDGKLDVVAVDFENDKVFIYKNLGGGAFAAPTSFATGTNPLAVVIADFDKDGTPDIAIASIFSQDIRVHRGLGSLTFATGVSTPIAGIPVQLATTDLDGDARTDIVCTDLNASKLRCYRNISDGASLSKIDLVAYADIDTAPAPFGLVAADLTGDGHAEFVVSSLATPEVDVFKLTGTTLSLIGTVTTDVVVGGMALADFDGDGKLDLAGTCPFADGAILWKGLGGGSFGAPLLRAAGQGSIFLAAGDATGDGVADLFVACASTGDISVFNGQTSGAALSGPNAIFVGGQPLLMSAGDLDGDGEPDLAIGDNTSDILGLFRNDGSLNFSNMAQLHTGAVSTYLPLLLDVDNDGDLDIAALHSGGMTLFRNTGPSTFTADSVVNFTGGLVFGVVADLEKDGRPEIVACSIFAGDVAVFHNDGSSLVLQQTFAAGAGAVTLDVADLDRDGDLDIVVANHDANTISIARRKKNVYQPNVTVLTTETGPVYVRATDFDRDGRRDIIVSHGESDDILLYHNHGKLQFDTPQIIPTNGRPLAMIVADVDQDGHQDVFYMEAVTGKANLRLAQKGGGIAAPSTTFASQYDISTPLFVDLDGDGLPELVTSSGTSGIIDIHKNFSH